VLISAESAKQDEHKPRAQRFPIAAPLRCRTGGELAWIGGATVNISRSGVLFLAERGIEPRTMLQMRIILPSELTGNGPASILCWGRITRAQPKADSVCRSLIAAAIIKYRFITGDSPELPFKCEL